MSEQAGATSRTMTRDQIESIARLTSSLTAIRSLEEIYEIAMDALASAIPIDRSSVLLFDDDAVLRFVASRGLSDGYRKAVEGHTPWSPDTKDPQPIVVADVLEDPDLAPYRDTIAGEGIRALGFIPLVCRGALIGKFMLYRDTPYEFTPDDLRVAGTIATNVALAVERARGEDALRRSHGQLQAILDGVTDGITAQAPDGSVVFANRAAAAAMGVESPDDLRGLRPPDWTDDYVVMQEDGSPFDLDSLPGRRALRGERPGATVVRYRPKESSDPLDRYALISAAPVMNSDGSVRYAINIFKDVSERFRVDEERRRLLSDLEREKNLLDSVVRKMPAGVMIVKPDGEVLLANDEIERICSLDRWLADDGCAVGDGATSFRRAVLEGDEIVGEEVCIERADGSKAIVLLNAAPIADADGNRIAVVATATDVNAIKRIEEEQRFLAKASEVLSSTLDEEEVLREIARLAVPTVSDWCTIDVVEESGELRRVTVAHRDQERIRFAEEMRRRYPPRDNGRGVHEVIRTGKPSLISTISAEMLETAAVDDEHLGLLRELGLCSAMIVPLEAHGRVLGGVTFVSSDSKRTFGEADLDLALDLARRAALAYDNARLYRREQAARRKAERSAERIARLQDVTAALSEVATTERVADVVIEQGVRAVGAHAGSIALRRGDSLQVTRTVGYPAGYIDWWRTIDLSTPLPLTDAVRDRRLVLIESLESLEEQYPQLKGKTTGENHAFAAIPLILDARVFGSIGLSFRAEKRFDDDDVAFMVSLGRQCAQALDRARLYEAEQQARREAESANRAKDEFLATLSHELRTPLTATLGWSRMLTYSEVDDETRQLAVESIYRSSQAQARIVDDLLDVSRIVTGKMKIDLRPTDLGDVVSEAIEAVRAAAEAKSIRIEQRSVGSTAIILGDPDRMRQVVWNLISNSIKFTEAGGRVTVTLSTEGSESIIEVSDDGQGISSDVLPHVFERFRQGDSSATRLHGGLGLGLSIVRHLVELHGGTVAVSSDGPGRGATFRIALPSREAAMPPAENRSEQERPDITGRKILLVDDEYDTRLLMETILRRSGGNVSGVASVAQAFEKLAAETFDVLVSDLAMPEEDGLSLIRRLRSRNQSIPALAVTAYGRSNESDRALAAGFDDYLRKPIDPDEFVRAVARLLERRGGEDQIVGE